MVPMSRKRSSSFEEEEEEGIIEEPASKRHRSIAIHPRTFTHDASATKAPSFNDEPRQLLMRSAALTLEHVGFTGAHPEALEAICAQAETC